MGIVDIQCTMGAREKFRSHWQVFGAEFAKTPSTGKDTTMNSKYFHEHDEESYWQGQDSMDLSTVRVQKYYFSFSFYTHDAWYV